VTVAEEEGAVLAAVRAGDESAFVALAERYRRQLHVHCYRMLGSFEEAEDMVQETLLRAWKGRHTWPRLQRENPGSRPQPLCRLGLSAVSIHKDRHDQKLAASSI
jgi:Sigma-70 region 2